MVFAIECPIRLTHKMAEKKQRNPVKIDDVGSHLRSGRHPTKPLLHNNFGQSELLVLMSTCLSNQHCCFIHYYILCYVLWTLPLCAVRTVAIYTVYGKYWAGGILADDKAIGEEKFGEKAIVSAYAKYIFGVSVNVCVGKELMIHKIMAFAAV